jgi:hypothetical protein
MSPLAKKLISDPAVRELIDQQISKSGLQFEAIQYAAAMNASGGNKLTQIQITARALGIPLDEIRAVYFDVKNRKRRNLFFPI